MTPALLYMLDTNTASFILSGRSPAARKKYLETDPHARIVISSITEAEIRFGFERKPEAARLRRACEEFLTTIEILPWDSNVARTYGKLRAGLASGGVTLALMDLLIATHATAANATLVTHDKAFRQLAPSLTVINWATDL